MSELFTLATFLELPLWGKIAAIAFATPVVAASLWGTLCKNCAMVRGAWRAGLHAKDRFTTWRHTPSAASVERQAASAERQAIALALREQARVNVQVAEEMCNLRKSLS